MIQHWHTVWLVLINILASWPPWPSNSTLWHSCKKIEIHVPTKISISIFLAALFIVVKNGIHCGISIQCLTMRGYGMNELLTHAEICKSIKNILLSKRCQNLRNTYYVIQIHLYEIQIQVKLTHCDKN